MEMSKVVAAEVRRIQYGFLGWIGLLFVGLIGYLVSGSYALDRADTSRGGNQWWMQIPKVFVIVMAVAFIGAVVWTIRGLLSHRRATRAATVTNRTGT